MVTDIDREKCNKIRLEYVFTLRAILREISTVNRSPENLAVAEEIEHKLNELVVEAGNGQMALGLGKAAA